jgi:hypothetical protein
MLYRAVLAGKDATVALSTMDMTPAAFQPGAAAKLTPEQQSTLRNWQKRYREKYKASMHLICLCQFV